MTYASAIQASKDQVKPAHPAGLVSTTLAASRRVSKLPTLGGSQGPRPVPKLAQAFGKISMDIGNDGKQARTIWITNEAITFGKSPDADIRIVGLNVANWHCHLKFEDPNLALLKKDEGSETSVNGQGIFGTEEERVNGFRLSDGDSIRIGARKFKFEYCKERKHSNSIIAAMSRNDQNLASTIGNTPLRQENKISVVKGTPIHPVEKSAVNTTVATAPRQGLSLRNATEEPQVDTKSGLFATQMVPTGEKRRKSTTTSIVQKSSHDSLLSKSRKTVAVPEAAAIAAKANTNESQAQMECRKLLQEAMAKANQVGVFGSASIPPATNSLPIPTNDSVENKMEMESMDNSVDNKENSRVPLPDQSTVFATATATAELVAVDPVSAPTQSTAPGSDQQPQMKAKTASDKSQRIKRLSLYPASAVGMPSKSNRELRKTIGFKGDDRVAIPFLANAQQMNSSPVHSTRIEVEVIHSRSVKAENASEKPEEMITQDSSMVDELSTGRVSTPVNIAPPGTPVAVSSKGSQPKSAKISKEGQLFHFYKNLPPATPVHVSKERILSPGSGSSVDPASEAMSSPAGSFVERLELVAKEEMNESPMMDSRVSHNSTPSSVSGAREIDLESYASSPRTLEDSSSPVASVKSTPKNTPIPSPGSLMKRVSDAFKASPAAAFLSRPLSYLGTPVNVPNGETVAPTPEKKAAPAEFENVEKSIETEVAENMVRSPVAALQSDHDRSYEDVQELVEEMGQVSLECTESSSDAMEVAESAQEVANEEGPKRVFKRVHIIFDDEGSETVEYIEETIENGNYDEIDEVYDENDQEEYEEYLEEENVEEVEVPEEISAQETNQDEKVSVPRLRKFDARIAQSVQREHLIFDDSPGGRQHWLLAEEDPNQTFVIPNDGEEDEDAVSEPSVRDVFDLLAHCDDTDAEVETFGTPMSIGSVDGNLFVVKDAQTNKPRNPDLLAAMKAGFDIRPMDTPERRDLGKSDPVGFLVRPRGQHQTTPVGKRKIHTPWVVEGDSDSEDAEEEEREDINETAMDDVSANVSVQRADILEEEMAKLEITSSPTAVDGTSAEVVVDTIPSQNLYPTLSAEVVNVTAAMDGTDAEIVVDAIPSQNLYPTLSPEVGNETGAMDSVKDVIEVHATSAESIDLIPAEEADQIKVLAPNENEPISNESPSRNRVSENDMESSAVQQEELSTLSQNGPAMTIQSSDVIESCPPQSDDLPMQESPSVRESNEMVQDVQVDIDDSVPEESEEPINTVTEPEPEIQNDVVMESQTEVISKSEEPQQLEQNVTEDTNADVNVEEEATVRRSARIRSKQTVTAVTPARPAVQTPNPRGGRSRSRARLAPPEEEVIPESEPVLTESTDSNIPEPTLVEDKQPEEVPKKSVGRGRGRKAASVEVEEEPESKEQQENSEDDKENQEEDMQVDSNATRTPYNLRRRAPVTPAANTAGKSDMVTTGGRTTRSRAARAVTPVAGNEQDEEEPCEFEEGRRTRGRKATARR